MRMTLRNRLTGAFMMVAVVSAGGAGVLIDRTVRHAASDQVAERLRYEVTMTGQIMASALFAPLSAGDKSLCEPVRDLAAAVHTHLSLLTPEGVVAADSEAGPEGSPEPAGGAEEVHLALRDGQGTSVRGAPAAARMWVAEKVVRDGRTLGVARASVPMTVVERQVSAIRAKVLLACLGALIFAALIGFALSRTMSRSLKKLIDALDARNAEMRYVLDAIDQGLVLVDMNGEIAGERSARVDEWFDTPAKGARLCDVFRGATADVIAGMRIGWQQVVDDFLPMEVVLDQLPRRVVAGARTFDLAYAPIAAAAGQSRILVVISDTTTAAEAERKEMEQKDLLGIFGRCFRDQAAVVDFLRDSDSLVASVLSTSDLVVLKRNLHTLKGNCGLQGIAGIAAMCHEIESRIAEEGGLSAADAEHLRARWGAFRENTDMVLVGRDGIVVDEQEMEATVTAILRGEPRDAIAQRIKAWAHAPASVVLSTLGERAQKLAGQLGKGTLAVRVEHDDTRFERERWAPFWSALIHAVRNAIDHGLEAPEERAGTGKPAACSLRLSARHDSGELRVEVADDGRGISWERVARKLVEHGRPAATKEDLMEGLFADGLSTADSVTEVSGRGVGMGALREVVRSLGGTIEIDSEEGKGTVVRCRFPEEEAPMSSAFDPPSRRAPPASIRVTARRSSDAPLRSGKTLPPPRLSP
jgi:signal transduction histidine kinase